jgi:hypothetical protein
VDGAAPVIFGKGDEPLLGAKMLESIGFIPDPFKRRLIPIRMLLALIALEQRQKNFFCVKLAPKK